MAALSAGEWTEEDFESGDFEALKEEGDRAAGGDRDNAEMPRAVAAGAGDAVGVELETEGDEDFGSDFEEPPAAAVAACLTSASFASPPRSLAL